MNNNEKELEAMREEAHIMARQNAEIIWDSVNPKDFTSASAYVAECRERVLDALADGVSFMVYGLTPFDYFNTDGISEKDYRIVTEDVDDVYADVEAGRYDHVYKAA